MASGWKKGFHHAVLSVLAALSLWISSVDGSSTFYHGPTTLESSLSSSSSFPHDYDAVDDFLDEDSLFDFDQEEYHNLDAMPAKLVSNRKDTETYDDLFTPILDAFEKEVSYISQDYRSDLEEIMKKVKDDTAEKATSVSKPGDKTTRRSNRRGSSTSSASSASSSTTKDCKISSLQRRGGAGGNAASFPPLKADKKQRNSQHSSPFATKIFDENEQEQFQQHEVHEDPFQEMIAIYEDEDAEYLDLDHSFHGTEKSRRKYFEKVKPDPFDEVMAESSDYKEDMEEDSLHEHNEMDMPRATKHHQREASSSSSVSPVFSNRSRSSHKVTKSKANSGLRPQHQGSETLHSIHHSPARLVTRPNLRTRGGGAWVRASRRTQDRLAQASSRKHSLDQFDNEIEDEQSLVEESDIFSRYDQEEEDHSYHGSRMEDLSACTRTEATGFEE